MKYKDRSIADVLAMRVDEAVAVLRELSRRRAGCWRALQEVGLGYLTLGQSSTTLSGGEAQRIKLATELARVDTGNTLYLLDEPTTGPALRRHPPAAGGAQPAGRSGQHGDRDRAQPRRDQVRRLDHRPGPRGGAAGGYVVATGTPEEVAAVRGNHTGAALGGCWGRV